MSKNNEKHLFEVYILIYHTLCLNYTIMIVQLPEPKN